MATNPRRGGPQPPAGVSAAGITPQRQTECSVLSTTSRRAFGHRWLIVALAALARHQARAVAAFADRDANTPPRTDDALEDTLVHPSALTRVFDAIVRPRLQLPAGEQAVYARLLWRRLDAARVRVDRPQWLVLVDRSAQVQAAMVWWVDAAGATGLVGATPASTGRPWGFEHFATPLGVFAHTLDNPDFRAEGTVNALGIRGYGERGMRVYDFGWVLAERGWAPGSQPMRLQLHATDPVHLEPHLGTRASKGCIRVPARLNTLLDRWGVLDADYDAAAAATGRGHWVLRPDRILTPWTGRWLVVVETDRAQRPAWSTPTCLRQ